MANRIKSARKKHRQSLVRRERNKRVRSPLRKAIRKLNSVIEARDKERATEMLRAVVRALDKAATKGVIHKKNASRHVSRLSRKAHRLVESESQAQ